MSESTCPKLGLADYVVARRKRKECFLDEIDRLSDWSPLENLLRKMLKRVVNAVGNPAYPPFPMFKIWSSPDFVETSRRPRMTMSPCGYLSSSLRVLFVYVAQWQDAGLSGRLNTYIRHLRRIFI